MRSWPWPGFALAVTDADWASSSCTSSPVVGSVPLMAIIGSPLAEPNTLKVGPGLETTKGTGTQKSITAIATRAMKAVASRQLTSGACSSRSPSWRASASSCVEVISVSFTVQLCRTGV